MRICRQYSTWILLFISISVVCSQELDSFVTCKDYEFRCSSGQCVNGTLQCDGVKDCTDGSDETFWLCRQLDLKCSPSSFKCAYGACVDGDALCNGVKDCADNSDELHPSCFKANLDPVQINSRCDKIYNFTCLSGDCVDAVAVCDGQVDCKDGSDESLTQCFNMTCQPNSFQCAYGGCIDGDKLCNDEIDCFDGTDEVPEFCSAEEEPTPQQGSTIEEGPGCYLPEQPKHGKYLLGGCKSGQKSDYCESEPGTKVRIFTQITYECNRGYVLPVYHDGRELVEISDVLCLNEGWRNNITCRKMCQPLFSEPHILECEFNGKKVPCDQYSRPNTKLMPRCKPFYHPQEPVSVYRHTWCMDDGQWQDPLFKCIPDSGGSTKGTAQKNKHTLTSELNPVSPNKPEDQNFQPCKECHTTAPSISDRVLLCLALVNAGVPISKFRRQSLSKVGQKKPYSPSNDANLQMIHAFNVLFDLYQYNKLSRPIVLYEKFTRKKRYSCYDASFNDELIDRTHVTLVDLKENIESFSEFFEQTKETKSSIHNNSLVEEMQKKMGNSLKDAIKRCKRFDENGMDELLKTLQ